MMNLPMPLIRILKGQGAIKKIKMSSEMDNSKKNNLVNVRNFSEPNQNLEFEETFDDYLKNPGKYLRRMEDNLLKEILYDSPNTANK